MEKPNIKQALSIIFASLRHRDFRYFWFGQCISLTGTWVQRTAQVWLIYSLTNSPLLVGMLGVCQFMPMLLFSLFAGAVVDRFPKKQMLIVTQTVFMLQAVCLTLLTLSGHIQYWHIFILSAVFGLTQTFDMPARQSFFIDMVGKEDLMNAISLNSTIVNLSRIVGPAISGIIMEALGPVWCFFINAVSYLAVIAGLLMVRTGSGEKPRFVRHLLPEVTAGVRYIAKNEVLVVNVLMMAAICTFAMNNDVILPIFAKTALGRGASGYTGLMSAAGAGAFCGAVYMAARSAKGLKKQLLFYAAGATAALQLAAAFTHSYALSLVLVAGTGFVNLVFINTANSVFQLNSTDEYRGRVMSVYAFLNQGSTPVGNFFAGTVMEHLGGGAGFLWCGAVTAVLMGVVAAVKRASLKRDWLGGGKGPSRGGGAAR